MAAAHGAAALPAPAAVDAEAAAQRLGRQFDLVLLVLVRCGDRAAAVGAGVGQWRVEVGVDLVVRQGRPMAVAAVLVTGFAARGLGVGFGGLLREGGGLAFGLTLGGF